MSLVASASGVMFGLSGEFFSNYIRLMGQEQSLAAQALGADLSFGEGLNGEGGGGLGGDSFEGGGLDAGGGGGGI